MSERALTVEALDAFIGGGEPADDLRLYLDAASVLTAFDPVELKPTAGTEAKADPAIFERLLPLCEPNSAGPHRGLWSLTLAERRAALERLATREAMRAALDTNPKRPDTRAQHVLEQLVDGSLPPLETLDREGLAALVTVSAWLRGFVDVPPEDEVRAALARLDLTAPMWRLVSGGFVNRVAELRQLEAYVTLPVGMPPLFVHGPGGVGKSTLLARFLLTELDRGRPYAYIDLDRPTIRADEPTTLLLDLLDQLDVQLDLGDTGLEALSERLAEQRWRVEQSRSAESYGPRPDVSFVESFLAGLWPPALVVVDTFEEADFLGPDVVETLTDFILQLAPMPGLRVIVAGRTLPEESMRLAFPGVASRAEVAWPHTPINVGVLDRQPAQELLQSSIRRSRVPALTREEIDEIIGLVTPNPMCLMLAARLLKVEGIGRLRQARAEFYAQLRAEKIQALLYGRILNHVHDEHVKKIAYPGLIVRRITPEVIRDVLAVPCKLELTTQRSELDLFADLAREAALVETDPSDGSLRHRTDVRRAMLEDLTDHVSPELVDQIDRAAIDFYARCPADNHVARAEEIYHRLRRGEDEATLDQRWLPAAAPLLKSAGDELPARQRIWLAERLGMTLDATVRAQADQEAWESQAARSADRYLQGRRPESALAVLHERRERLPRSRLYLLEFEAHRMRGTLIDARRVGRAGVDALSAAGAIDMTLELLLAMVGVEEVYGDLDLAVKLLDEARAIASHSSNEVLRLRTDITALRIERRLHPEQAGTPQTTPDLAPELLLELRSFPVLLREVAAELASENPEVASAAIETLGLEIASDEQALALGHALASLVTEVLHTAAKDERIVEAVDSIAKSEFDPNVVRELATHALTSRQTRAIGRDLLECSPHKPALSEWRDYFRAGVDSSLRGSSRDQT